MAQDDNHDAGPSALLGSPSDSDHDTSSDGFPPSAKLRDKLKKLADQRLNLSSIEFLNGAPEFHGGFAIVSRALLVSPSSNQDRAGQSNSTTNDGLNSPGPPGEGSRQRKDVAVKKMKISDDTAPERILGLALREAEFLVGLSHENIIKLEGFVEDLSNGKDVVWLVFPWADNGHLKNFIASAEWEIPERISLIYDVARGVKYLHSQQPPIRHGDLKSINILINSECRAVITDFGSARRQTTEDLGNEASQAGNQPQPALSLEPRPCGPTNTLCITLTGDHYTLRWAAPELLNEGKGTLASDIWALGCVVYEVMTNSIPFQDVVQEATVIMRVVMGDLPSITDSARLSLIRALCSVVLACWSMDPRKRPTAEDCQNSIHWMPMIKPDPIRTADAAACRARSPALLMQLGSMHVRQGDYPNALDFFNNALCSYGDVGDSKGKAAALAVVAQVHRLQHEYSQAVKFYNQALQICSEIGDSKERANALGGLAEVCRLQNEYSRAIAFYTEALQLRADVGDKQGRADALSGLADVHRLRNEYSPAIGFYTEALQVCTEIGDKQGRAYALAGLADVHRLRNEYSQAVTFYTEALQIRTDIGDKRGRAYALFGLADVHRVRNEYSQAVAFYTEALQLRTSIGDRQGRAYALWGLAHMHRLQDKYSQAVSFYTEALQIRTDIGDRQGRAYALWGLAEVHRLQDEYSQASKLFSEALQICTDIGDRRGRANAVSALAHVHRLQKEYGQAVAYYTEALQVRTEIGDRRGRANALSGLAEVHRIQREYTQATRLFSEALHICTDIGDRYGRAIALRDLAHVHRLQNEYSQANTLFSKALETFTDIGSLSGRAKSLSGLGDLHRDQGNYREAIGPYSAAAEVFEQIGNTRKAAYALNEAAKIRQLST